MHSFPPGRNNFIPEILLNRKPDRLYQYLRSTGANQRSALKNETILMEVSWETCHQIGGIYTFLRSRLPVMKNTYGDRYFVLGPYLSERHLSGFSARPSHHATKALDLTLQLMEHQGYVAKYGYWLDDATSVPVVLLDLASPGLSLNKIKHEQWELHNVDLLNTSPLVDQSLLFGEIVKRFVENLCQFTDHDLVLHFHEWLTAASLPEIAQLASPVTTVFTTHATLLGRYLTPNVANFKTRLHSLKWKPEAQTYGILPEATIERNAVQYAHACTTVSESTAQEILSFNGKQPDAVIPNGIPDGLPVPLTRSSGKTQNKDLLDQFVKSHFSPSYPLPSENVFYFFTSGRFEYYNKGFDLLLEALAVLDYRLRSESSPIRIVQFIIAPKEVLGLDPTVVESKARYRSLKELCYQISRKATEHAYSHITRKAGSAIPDLNRYIDDDLLRQWKQSLREFKRTTPPPISTHLLQEEDEILKDCRKLGLVNGADNCVKIVYHPQWVDHPRSPLGMHYSDFVGACDLGIFPARYEPWGYAATESLLYGIPTLIGKNAGIAGYLEKNRRDAPLQHVGFLNTESKEECIREIAGRLYEFVSSPSRENCEVNPTFLGKELNWQNIQKKYHEIYLLATMRKYLLSRLY